MLFYSGDIVVRKGASTERVDQSAMRRIISDIRQREKAHWTEDILGMRELVQRLDQLIGLLSNGSATIPQASAAQAAPLPHTSFDETLLYLSPSVMYRRIMDLLDNQRNVLVQRYIQEAASQFFQHVKTIATPYDVNTILELRDNRLIPILDSLLAIAVTSIDYKQWDLFQEVQAVFYRLCYQAEKGILPDVVVETFVLNKIWLWQEVIIRVYALGAVLVYRRHWQQAQTLIEQEIEWDDYYRTEYWSRYIITMASRARQLQENGWIPAVVSYIESQEWLSYIFMGNKDEITNLACQFDFLQCVYTNITDTGTFDVKRAYPSFAFYYKDRTEPVIGKLITPGELRDTISELNDQQLATLIRALDRLADELAIRVNGWHSGGWSDQRIRNFLAAHPSEG